MVLCPQPEALQWASCMEDPDMYQDSRSLEMVSKQHLSSEVCRRLLSMNKAGIAAHVSVSAALRGLGAADATNSFIYSWLHGMLGAE